MRHSSSESENHKVLMFYLRPEMRKKAATKHWNAKLKALLKTQRQEVNLRVQWFLLPS